MSDTGAVGPAIAAMAVWCGAGWALLKSGGTAVWPVAGGVVIAWLFQQYAERRKRKRLRRALDEECRALLVGQVPQFIDLFSRIRTNLERQIFLPGLAVRAMSIVYREAIKELGPHLTIRE